MTVKPIHILFIDDSRLVQRAFEYYIHEQQLNLQCDFASTLSDAHSKMKKNTYDVLILDYLLKDGTGFDLLVHNPERPIIFTTGYGNEDIAVKAMQAGAFDYIIKDPHQNFIALLAIAVQNAHAKYIETALLKDEQTRYQLLFEQSPFGIVIIDPSTALPIEFNPKAYEQLGYTADEFRQLHIADYEVQENKKDVSIHIHTIMETGSDIFETKHRTKNGELLDILVTAKMIPLYNQQMIHAIFQDISAYNTMQLKLQKSEQRFKLQYKNIPVPTFTWQKQDDDFILLDYNTEAEHFTNNQIIHLIHKTAKEMYADRPDIIQDIYDCFAQQRIIRREMEYALRSTDKQRYLIVDYAYVPNDLVMIHIRDVTEQREQQNKINILAKFPDENPNPVFRVSKNGILLYANRASRDLLQRWNISLYDSLPDIVKETILSALSMQDTFEQEIPVEDFVYHFTIVPLAKLEYVYLYVKDITKDRENEFQLQLAAEVFKTSNEAILITDAHSNIVNVNNAFTRITGYSREEIVGKNPNIMKSGHHDKDFYEDFWHALQEKGRWQGEIWDRRKSGETYPKSLSVSTVYNAEGKTTHYVGIFSDITKIKRSEQQLKHLAYYDALTDIPNRILFFERLDQAIIQSQNKHQSFSLLFLDLDRFKIINDTLGHQTGDELLVQVAKRLSECVEQKDTVARYGGDEFSIILRNIPNPFYPAQIAERIIQQFNTPFELHGKSQYVTLSIGISIFPEDSINIDGLVKNADLAMYYAKRNGKNNFQFSSGKISKIVEQELIIENELRQALANHEFYLLYQPQLDLNTDKIIGLEALIRWKNKNLGYMNPGQFIRIAEESGLIVPIGDWVLKTACKQAKTWLNQGVPPVRIAVNLSVVQFNQPDFEKKLMHVITTYQVDPTYLDLEVTETMLMSNPKSTSEVLQTIKNHGVSISIDDFGTGFSSLSYLKDLPLDYIKIDQSFINTVQDQEGSASIVEATINLSHSLHLKVIAEGVETQEQKDFLKNHQCDIIQGYLISKPIPPDQVTDLLKNQ